jgi:hypothetical protein
MISKVDLKLYLEGLMVPVYSATVKLTASYLNTCDIAIAPNTEGLKLRPRTHVVVAYFDPSSNKDVVLFEGELYSLGTSRGKTGNSIIINAVDVSSYLANYRPYYFDKSFSAPEQYVHGIESSSSKIATAFQANGGGLVASLRSIANQIFNQEDAGVFRFFNLSESRLKLSERLDGATGKFPISGGDLKDYVSQAVGQFGHSSILELFSIVPSLILHKFISIPNPSLFTSEPPKTWAIIPDLFYAPPPMCNVMFPSQLKVYTWMRPYLTQTTRLRLRDYRTESSRLLPASLRKTEIDVSIQPSTLKITDAKRDTEDLTADELERGPVPSEENLFVIPRMARSSTAKAGSSTFRKQIAEYQFKKANIESGTIEMATLFNPYIVPGFPGLVIDTNGFVFHGLVDSAVHHISKGSIVTRVSMSHTTQFSSFKEFDPPFVDSEWEFASVGDGFRRVLSPSIQTLFEHFETSTPGEIIQELAKITERDDIINRIFRPLVPVVDFFGSLGSEPNEDETIFTGPTFVGPGLNIASDEIDEPEGEGEDIRIPDRQIIVRNYLKSLT